jgi:hypothetical protein
LGVSWIRRENANCGKHVSPRPLLGGSYYIQSGHSHSNCTSERFVSRLRHRIGKGINS